MNGNKINYFFDHKNKIFTVRKDYTLQLQATDSGIEVKKRDHIINAETREYKLDQSERYTGRMTSAGVYKQLANIRQIVFETTDACNLRCAYCAYGEYYDNFDEREDQYIDTNKAKLLIDFIIGKKHTSANISQQQELTISFYGGEPLMNMDFIQDIIAYTQAKGDSRVQFKYSMTTNGILLKKNIDLLVDNNFAVLVSLDGAERHDAYRKFKNGKSSFAIVYENLKYIECKYPIFFKENISFNAVIHNLNNVVKVFHFFQDEFNKIPSFSSVSDTGVKLELQNAFKALSMPKERVWFRIRNQTPCNDYVYQWLCPPPSNYEIFIGRPNLCHIKK